MNARRFDALAIAIAPPSRRTNRRAVVRGMVAVAVTALAPGAALAFDGGVSPVAPLAVGGIACLSGVDCPPGSICLNGACAPRDAAPVGGPSGSTGGTAGTVTGGTETTPGTVPVNPPETTPEGGVGGLIQPGEPLPARIFAGRCGQLGADPAFQLIDVGPVEGIEEGEEPEGALTAIPAEFSTTVVNATLEDLLASDFAIDVRVTDGDPATSIACGDIGGPIETGPDGQQLAVGLQERGQSAYSGIALLQDEGERTLVQVFLARGLSGDAVTTAQAAPEVAEEPAPQETTADAAQAAATPVAGPVSPIGPGARLVTTIDVNLRAEPAEDAAVLSILGQGAELEVTGAPADGWVPVVEPGSGQRGFVSEQFVTIAP